nr:hypothetical protein [Tanacetum cinerariifolium]
DAQNIDADTDVRSRHVLLLKIVGPILHLMKVHNIQIVFQARQIAQELR